MAHEWDRGILEASSWHGLEEVGTMADAEAMIAAGDRTGACPTALQRCELFTSSGLQAPRWGLLASYANHADRVVATNGEKYRATQPEEWRNLIRAASDAGARPTGIFSLCDGARVLATFQVDIGNGIQTNLLLVDSFDGSTKLSTGFTSIRVLCANTLAVAFAQDGKGMAKLLHTAQLEVKINVLIASIKEAIKTGGKIREEFAKASSIRLDKEAASAAFDQLFPPADVDASQHAVTRAETIRSNARIVAAMPINKVGNEPGNLATLWNAATYLVDRNADGTARRHGESDRLNSLLFGGKSRRLEEIATVIEVVMRDGTIVPMNAHEARDAGIDDRSIGRAVLDDMLG